MKERLPLIFAIHRFALDDGPGIRTTVFLKGCPLSCVWCHNPESMRADREMAFYPDKCIHCGQCRRICPEEAIADEPVLRIDRSLCTACGWCAENCPTLAIRKLGKAYSREELLEILLRDRHFFSASGGGVTFSGGEPTLWMDYLSPLLQALKGKNISTAIQTCGFFDYDVFSRKILPNIDLIFFDIKLMSAADHKKYTGQDNAVILDNFRHLTKEAGHRLLPRVPLVPGISAVPANLLAIAAFLAELGHARCDLLSYNPAGIDKRRVLGKKPSMNLPESPLDPAEEETLRHQFRERLLFRGQSKLNPKAA
ncbi:MAG: Benzylsuccinate synthase activating enzyme [Syntrophus sp. PtaU1.Bin208]|nr:MAG: Benzylsuccinate synthase activating enzyme [Syntrophus sp. PtaU1.Bin208]